MIIKCIKIKMIWFLILVLDWGYLVGVLFGLVKGGGGGKKEKRIGLCFVLNFWSGWWYYVLFFLGWIDFYIDIFMLLVCVVFYGVYIFVLFFVWIDD